MVLYAGKSSNGTRMTGRLREGDNKEIDWLFPTPPLNLPPERGETFCKPMATAIQ
jgi:hypothetical protein